MFAAVARFSRALTARQGRGPVLALISADHVYREQRRWMDGEVGNWPVTDNLPVPGQRLVAGRDSRPTAVLLRLTGALACTYG